MSHQEAADLQATIKATITNIQAQLSDPTIADGIWRTRAARAKSYCIRRMSVVKQHLAATAHERREARQKRVEEGRAQHEYKLAELQRLRDLAAEGSTQEALVGLLDFMLRQRKTRAEKKS
ncbi:MAG: hypothetical protein K0U16_07535 [Gammaproteobacteria bacterium]|nr:hypothetical protein [Gammaproteobacteria bacterium]